ncbi:hypothetical protein BEWA_052150 [Theileria equi strain WA]|uniref:Homologous recombination OB-fold protein OB-fold domain-containing protein n=1 Tax=Theileria equi strain WA TaxID=1537102 RepID=L1LCU1_THEEQ|nr:hypothetical protein BEWA_052150 [Theileria equi strain WA]EKX73161.1 hypothetical protein BEWA_052150 [Theileria equi strain WA]|eukprot:XP_004832613.1 hypothetical protein BEWA_052150 [Theileria equi strain WA]
MEEMSVGQFITNKFNIRKILLSKGSKVFRIDYLLVSVKSIVPADPNLILVVTDKTGQMLGCLHKDAIATYRNSISPGSTILLCDISVYVPAGHNPYLLITGCNIKHIFDGIFRSTNVP